MKKILYLPLLPLLMYSCSSTKQRNDILTTGNLESQFFYVDPGRDTVLKTSHAASVRIQKGTFPSSQKISIEIKEAYRPDEILLAGLGTTSGGKPLRSAGMLYFNATSDGKPVEPSLPVAISIPTNAEDTAMKLFKGEEQADGSIDWVEPVSLDTAMPKEQLHRYEWGKVLFNGKCGSCHRIFNPATGPALRNVQNRGPWKNPKNLLAWINNPAVFMARSQYAMDLKRQYGSVMTAFPDLQAEDVEALLTYLNLVKEEPQPPAATAAAVPDTVSERDCGYDTAYLPVTDTYAEYDTTGSPLIMDTSDDNSDDTSYAGDEYSEYSESRYDITINANGWYNVDAYMKPDNELASKVKLTAQLNQPAPFYMDVYLVIPSEKVMQPSSGYEGSRYRFIVWNGTIRLPLRYRALIFAVGSYKDKIYYGVTEFTIASEQTISVEIKETSRDGLKNLIHSRQMDGVEINAIERKMELLKRDCGN